VTGNGLFANAAWELLKPLDTYLSGDRLVITGELNRERAEDRAGASAPVVFARVEI